MSGGGSNLEQTRVIRQAIPQLLNRLNICSMLDAPCGDFYWMQRVDLGDIEYVGADIVVDLIQQNKSMFGSARRAFIQADLITSDLPQVDLIFCRDCLVHLRNNQVIEVIKNFKKSGARYLLTTTFTQLKNNQERPEQGYWRPLNLQLAPFNFPAPLVVINEGCTEDHGRYADKSLGLWLLEDLL